MKRTIEIILTSIGILMSLFFVVVSAFMVWIKYNFNDAIEIVNDFGEMSLSELDIESLSRSADTGPLILTISILMIILAVIGIYLIKGNRNPKAAGIILISAAVIGVFISPIVLIVNGGFFIAAGIMALVRKPPIEEPEIIDEI